MGIRFHLTRVPVRALWLERGPEGPGFVPEDRLNEPADPRPARFQQLHELTAREVAGLGTEIVNRPFVVAITGDRERLDTKALAKLGTIHDIKPDELFSFGPFPNSSVSVGDQHR